MPSFFHHLGRELTSLRDVALGRGRGLYEAYSHYRASGNAKDLAADLLRLYPDRKMINLRIDSDSKTVHLEVQLEGQTEPLIVEGAGLRVLEDEHGDAYVTLDDVTASPRWLAAALKPLGLGRKRFPLPPDYVDLAKLAI